MAEAIIERLYAVEAKASRVNPESSHRRELRAILKDNDMRVAEALLWIDQVAKLHPEFGPMHIDGLVRDAKRVLAWTR